MKTYNTFKYYDKSGRRLAIFCQIENGIMNITTFPCSKSDTFSKKRAWEIYQNEKVEFDVSYKIENINGVYTRVKTPGVFKEVIKENFTVKGEYSEDFIRWCNLNFAKRKTVVLEFDSNVELVSIKKRRDGLVEIVISE